MSEGNVIDITEYLPHFGGEIRCTACNHRWVGVAAVGDANHLECPECHCTRGHFIRQLCPDSMIYACNQCEGSLWFARIDNKMQCASCGNQTTYPCCDT